MIDEYRKIFEHFYKNTPSATYKVSNLHLMNPENSILCDQSRTIITAPENKYRFVGDWGFSVCTSLLMRNLTTGATAVRHESSVEVSHLDEMEEKIKRKSGELIGLKVFGGLIEDYHLQLYGTREEAILKRNSGIIAYSEKSYVELQVFDIDKKPHPYAYLCDVMDGSIITLSGMVVDEKSFFKQHSNFSDLTKSKFRFVGDEIGVGEALDLRNKLSKGMEI